MFIQPAISRSYVPQSSAAHFAAKARAALSSLIDDSSSVSRHARHRDMYLPCRMPTAQREDVADSQEAGTMQDLAPYILTHRGGRPGITRAAAIPSPKLSAVA